MVNEAEVRALIIKDSRWKLLETLKLFYPASMSFRTLCLTLPAVELRHMKVDVTYLCDKGYARWNNQRPNMPWDAREYRLTASGVEAADFITNDPAVQPDASC